MDPVEAPEDEDLGQAEGRWRIQGQPDEPRDSRAQVEDAKRGLLRRSESSRTVSSIQAAGRPRTVARPSVKERLFP